MLHTGILQRFDTLDLNGDRRLSSFEFSEYFPPGNNAMVMSIFSTLDADGNFFVTYQEIVNAVNALESGTAPTEEGNKDDDYTQDPEEELANYFNNPGEDTNF